jgi:hypothetical protein
MNNPYEEIMDDGWAGVISWLEKEMEPLLREELVRAKKGRWSKEVEIVMSNPIEDAAQAEASQSEDLAKTSSFPAFEVEPHGMQRIDSSEVIISDKLEPLPDMRDPIAKEEALQGSVWRLTQNTIVNLARAQAAFISAQNAFIKDKDTAKIAEAQHKYIEAQAYVLAKFGVV